MSLQKLIELNEKETTQGNRRRHQAVTEKLLEIRELLVSHFKVVEAWVFGSFLHREEFIDRSDLDIALLLPDGVSPSRLGADIDTLLYDTGVFSDIIPLQGVTPEKAAKIRETGLRLV